MRVRRVNDDIIDTCTSCADRFTDAWMVSVGITHFAICEACLRKLSFRLKTVVRIRNKEISENDGT
jgi:hypothetical protein